MMTDTNSEAVVRELATVCAHCGGAIDTTVRRRHRSRKFCSDRCRFAWWQQRREDLRTELERIVELVGRR
jgi:hypothetical protein